MRVRPHVGDQAARLRAAAPRYLVLATLLLLLVLGLRSLVSSPDSEPGPRPAVGADAPSRAFVLQFARAYLTYDVEHPGLRARALAPYLSGAVDRDAGFFAAAGSQRVLWAEVASDQRALAGGRALTVAAQLTTQALPVYLTITVAHERGGPLALVGYPAFVGAPTISRAAPATPRRPLEDPAVAAVVERALRNYLAGSATNLSADLAPGTEVTLPTLALRVRAVESIDWLGRAGSAAVIATVAAVDPRGSAYTLAYEVGIAMRDRPYVSFIEVIPTAG